MFLKLSSSPVDSQEMNLVGLKSISNRGRDQSVTHRKITLLHKIFILVKDFIFRYTYPPPHTHTNIHTNNTHMLFWVMM